MATLTFTPDAGGSGASPIAIAGGVWLLFGTLTVSGSYTSGGDTLDLTKFLPAMSTIRRGIVIGGLRGFDGEYDHVNKKLKLWGVSTHPAVAEHTAATVDTDLSGSAMPVAFLLK